MSEVVEKLLEADIDASDYARGPMGNFIFAIGMQRKNDGIIKIWQPEGTEVKVYPDEEFRQAVISVAEGTRSVKTMNMRRRIRANYDYRTRSYDPVTLDSARSYLKARAEESIFIPGRRRTTISNLHWVDKKNWIAEASIEMRVAESNQTFLVGFDTNYHFVAALKKPARSVRGAHKQLRPGGLSKDYLRQGEWFFNPIGSVLAGRIDRYAFENPSRILSKRFESGSSHSGKQVVSFEDKMYAVGYITDSRRGHHEPLYLPEWHEVIRNNEIRVKPTAQRRYWD